MAFDCDGLDELLDKGAYHKLHGLGFNRVAGLMKIQNAVWLMPIVVLALLLASIKF